MNADRRECAFAIAYLGSFESIGNSCFLSATGPESTTFLVNFGQTESAGAPRSPAFSH